MLDLASGYWKAVDIVNSVLSEHQLARRPVPVRQICRSHGIRIIERAIPRALSMADLRGRVIYVRDFSETRKRFYIAHELGHFLLPKEFHETSYSTFAGCLLIPHDWILEDHPQAAPAVLADWYQVTSKVMRIRLEQLGIQTSTEPPF